MSKAEKEKEKLEKKLTSVLSSAASAKAWSDLLPITKDILQLLSKTTDVVNFSKLSNKLLLAKSMMLFWIYIILFYIIMFSIMKLV